MDAACEGLCSTSFVSPTAYGGRDSTRKRSFRHTLLTTDGVRIAAAHDAGPPGADVCVVLAHGFSGALERPAVRRAVAAFRGRFGVVTFSFRGHGTSGGRSSVGDREVLDMDAAVAWARRLGYRAVAAVGFSMGGSVVLRHAAGRDGVAEPVDAVVSVSAPARWYYRGTAPMRRLHWAVMRPAGRLVARYGLRVRVVDRDWDPVPLSPVESVPFIAPVPLLIVHGDRDAYFPLDHPCSLAQAAGAGAELWVERGFGHAENAAGPRLLARVAAWVGARTAAPGGPGPGGPAALPSPAGEASSWTAREG